MLMYRTRYSSGIDRNLYAVVSYSVSWHGNLKGVVSYPVTINGFQKTYIVHRDPKL